MLNLTRDVADGRQTRGETTSDAFSIAREEEMHGHEMHARCFQ